MSSQLKATSERQPMIAEVASRGEIAHLVQQLDAKAKR